MTAFAGFQLPQQNWSQLPHEFISALPTFDTMAELKVVLYILRHTWGYQEYDIPKHISVDEFMHGRKRKDGTRIDNGIGMSKNSIIDGLERAIKHGFVRVEVDNSDKARIEKWYAISMFANSEVQKLNPGIPKVEPRTEKETPETNLKKEDTLLTQSEAQAPQPVTAQQQVNEVLAETLKGELNSPLPSSGKVSPFTVTYIAPPPDISPSAKSADGTVATSPASDVAPEPSTEPAPTRANSSENPTKSKKPRVTDTWPQYGKLWELIWKNNFHSATETGLKQRCGEVTKALLARLPDLMPDEYERYCAERECGPAQGEKSLPDSVALWRAKKENGNGKAIEPGLLPGNGSQTPGVAGDANGADIRTDEKGDRYRLNRRGIREHL